VRICTSNSIETSGFGVTVVGFTFCGCDLRGTYRVGETNSWKKGPLMFLGEGGGIILK